MNHGEVEVLSGSEVVDQLDELYAMTDDCTCTYGECAMCMGAKALASDYIAMVNYANNRGWAIWDTNYALDHPNDNIVVFHEGATKFTSLDAVRREYTEA